MKSFALVFPGQGSQSVGMLADFIASNPLVAQTFQEANEALGYDLKKIVLEGSESELNQTQITQPAILTASIAAYRALSAKLGDLKMQAVAGHSLGEYSAVVAANALSFTDAVRLVRLRGQAMQEAVPLGVGAMSAILGLEDEVVIEGCKQCSTETEGVWAANFNTNGQVVISGAKAAVERANEYFSQKGAKRCISLPVSVPSHCPMMQSAADKLAVALQDVSLSDACVPLYSVALAAPISSKVDIVDALIKQLVGPVRWVETMKKLQADGVEALIEVGPGKVLTGLNRKIDRSFILGNIDSDASIDKVLESLA